MNKEVGLPKATILNLIKECLAADTRISTEANEIILGMTKEFVDHLSSISNDICLEGGKKTISQGHVAEALKKLKLNTYLAKIMNMEDCKELEGMTDK
jgi:histone H3/H4